MNENTAKSPPSAGFFVSDLSLMHTHGAIQPPVLGVRLGVRSDSINFVPLKDGTMARTTLPLTDSKCEAARYSPSGKGNKLGDGGGLFLLLKPTGSKSWRMKYTKPNGKEDLLVFGDYPAVTLKQARLWREDARAVLAQGIDPKEHEREAVIRQQQARGNTFEAVAREWHMIVMRKWSQDYAARYLKRMEALLFPEIGHKPIASLKTRDLILPIRKIEKKGTTDLATRMNQAIAGVMRYATQEGLIDSNPAHDLAGSVVAKKAVHRAALPLNRLPEFLARIDGYQGRALTRLAVKLTALVFVRSSELRLARWDEVDLKRALWTIPGERVPIEGVKHSGRGTKMRTEHLVPLSRQAVAVLEEIWALSGSVDLIFPGDHNHWRPISENTVNSALRRMGYDTKTEVCGHGFRTMACGSLVQSKLWQEDAVERQMSHQERNSVRLAYTHAADFLQERRLMMQWWADYLDANRQEHVSPYDYAHPEEVAKVVPFKKPA